MIIIIYIIVCWIIGFLLWLLEMMEANEYQKVDVFWQIMFVPLAPLLMPFFIILLIRGLLIMLAEYLFLNKKK